MRYIHNILLYIFILDKCSKIKINNRNSVRVQYLNMTLKMLIAYKICFKKYIEDGIRNNDRF